GPGLRAGLAARFAAVPYHWQVLVVIALSAFMVILDTTIVNVALPRIIQVFQTNVSTGQLVLAGYMLALAVVVPASGYLSDRFGAKRTYLMTIILFTLGSALCGLAPNIEGLIIFRVIQGLGGGMLMPLGMSLLFQNAPPAQRGTMMGAFGLPLLIAPMLGPTLGGYLVEYVDWRPIFTMNIPVGILATIAGMLILRETPKREGTRFDWAGFILSATCFSTAMLALEQAPHEGWDAPHVMILLLIAAVTFPCWIVVELAQEQPLLDLTILRHRTYAVAMMVNFVATTAMFSSMFLLPLFLQSVRGLGAMEAGMLLLPQAFAAAIMMQISGRLLDRFGPRRIVIPGLLILAFATWRLSGLDLNTSDEAIRVTLFIRGLAMGMVMMPVTATSMDSIPRHMIPRATALQNVLRQLFAAFGTGMFATILVFREQIHQANLVQDVTPMNIAAMRILTATQSTMIERGLSEAAAYTNGLNVLMTRVTQMAKVQSFDDCFFIATVIALMGIVPAMFLKRDHKPEPPHPVNQDRAPSTTEPTRLSPSPVGAQAPSPIGARAPSSPVGAQAPSPIGVHAPSPSGRGLG
ncbi:MAG TPA: DHA2 family efflux MFS transporter permease subunit, partial [Chloroflexota bacterium]|nr:DHA2 family efflux MFS transporter permease subunit [Chloroflexota bacterium]